MNLLPFGGFTAGIGACRAAAAASCQGEDQRCRNDSGHNVPKLFFHFFTLLFLSKYAQVQSQIERVADKLTAKKFFAKLIYHFAAFNDLICHFGSWTISL